MSETIPNQINTDALPQQEVQENPERKARAAIYASMLITEQPSGHQSFVKSSDAVGARAISMQ